MTPGMDEENTVPDTQTINDAIRVATAYASSVAATAERVAKAIRLPSVWDPVRIAPKENDRG